MRDWLMVSGSHLLNVMTGGQRGEMFCARAHRKRWWIAKLIGSRHCKAMWLYETRHNERRSNG